MGASDPYTAPKPQAQQADPDPDRRDGQLREGHLPIRQIFKQKSRKREEEPSIDEELLIHANVSLWGGPGPLVGVGNPDFDSGRRADREKSLPHKGHRRPDRTEIVGNVGSRSRNAIVDGLGLINKSQLIWLRLPDFLVHQTRNNELSSCRARSDDVSLRSRVAVSEFRCGYAGVDRRGRR